MLHINVEKSGLKFFEFRQSNKFELPPYGKCEMDRIATRVWHQASEFAIELSQLCTFDEMLSSLACHLPWISHTVPNFGPPLVFFLHVRVEFGWDMTFSFITDRVCDNNATGCISYTSGIVWRVLERQRVVWHAVGLQLTGPDILVGDEVQLPSSHSPLINKENNKYSFSHTYTSLLLRRETKLHWNDHTFIGTRVHMNTHSHTYFEVTYTVVS